MRPDLKVVLFRGNVQTRLRKLDEGEVDGTLLAYAGLKRLALADVVTDLMPLDEFPPAPGQGAICIETRIGDARIGKLIAPMHDAVDRGSARLRARLPGRARRLLPHADRRLCAYRRRPPAFFRA